MVPMSHIATSLAVRTFDELFKVLVSLTTSLSDCVECMAKSDNVIRAGLTPKFRDISILCSSLNYANKTPEQVLLVPRVTDEFTLSFKPPVEEFAVDLISYRLSASHAQRYTLPPKSSGSILLILKGTLQIGTNVCTEGSIYFIPAMLALPMLMVGKEGLCFRAYVS